MIYLSLSGGLDSSTLLTQYADEQVTCIGFNYQQRHRRELDAAQQVAAHYNKPFRVIDLPPLSGPALTGGEPVPHGHYEDESMKQTVVQGRNLMFITQLVALTQPGDKVAVAVHSGDHAIYGDCRPEFITPLASAIHAAYGVELLAPFLHKTKADIAALSAPIAALTWSCYEGGDQHCGKCGTCVERAEAFHEANTLDPTEYTDPDYWRTHV